MPQDSLLSTKRQHHLFNSAVKLHILSPDDLYDGLHPTARGHEKMFRRVAEALGV